jgi:hypothetical protein
MVFLMEMCRFGGVVVGSEQSVDLKSVKKCVVRRMEGWEGGLSFI